MTALALLFAAVIMATDSSHQPEHPPASAADGNFQTRWSSEFSDDQWLALDFGEPRSLAGVRLHWETAYGKDYDLLTSDDGKNWALAAAVRDGDGGRDEIYFAPRTARHLKLEGRKRGTGWGYSLWEIEPLGPDEVPALTASPGKIVIDCRQPREVGGLRLVWSRPPGDYTVNSDLAKITGSDGGTDVVYFPKQKFRSITIELTGNAELREFELKDDELTPMRQIESWDSISPAGTWPRWLRREQTFWTIVGEPGDPEESLVGEDGTIEPFAGAPCVMPFLLVNGRTLTSRDFQISHSLEAGYLPIPTVTWTGHGMKMQITAATQDGVTVVRYRLDGPGKLMLAVRPVQLNPPWQYGGLAKSKPERDLFRASIQPATVVRETGIESTFDAKEIFVAFPLRANAQPQPKNIFASQRRAWTKRLAGWRIESPIPGLQDIMRANLAYMLLNRDYAAAQPGPRNYAKAWMRDGALSATTYRRFGFGREAREYLEWFTPLVRDDGFVPFLVHSDTGKMPDFCRDWTEYDSQGQFVYAVAEDYRYTRDRDFARRVFPAVRRALDFQQARIAERRTEQYRDTEFYGLLPESNSHEGYFPGVHSYWDMFFALRGLGMGAELAEAIGESALAKEWRAEQRRVRDDLHSSMRRVMEKRNINYVPGCAEKGDFDVTSTSIAFTACGEDEALRAAFPQQLLAGYDRYFDEISIRFRTNVWPSFTPYEARNIEALVRLGQPERAVQLLEFLIGPCMRPTGWHSLAEVVHSDPRTGSYIGDMPHTWVGSDLINSARSLFVYEDGDALVLAAFPRAWRNVEVENLRTPFGAISYRLKNGELLVTGNAKPPGGFRVDDQSFTKLPIKVLR